MCNDREEDVRRNNNEFEYPVRIMYKSSLWLSVVGGNRFPTVIFLAALEGNLRLIMRERGDNEPG